MEIKNRYTNEIMYQSEEKTIKETVVSAVKAGANLAGADLVGADLTGADLNKVKGINKYRCTPLMILNEQVGKIRCYKIVNEKNEGIYKGGLRYEIGQIVSVGTYNNDDTKQCGAGINLATLDWCLKNYKKGYKILLCEFTAKDIACIPIATDGKFRVKKCKVIKEINLKKIGIEDE